MLVIFSLPHGYVNSGTSRESLLGRSSPSKPGVSPSLPQLLQGCPGWVSKLRCFPTISHGRSKPVECQCREGWDLL